MQAKVIIDYYLQNCAYAANRPLKIMFYQILLNNGCRDFKAFRHPVDYKLHFPVFSSENIIPQTLCASWYNETLVDCL